MSYNGSVELISGLKPKNDGNFPLIDAKDVYIADNKSLAELVSGLENTTIANYVGTHSTTGDVPADVENRLSTLETTVGTNQSDIGDISQEQQSLITKVTNLQTAVGTVDSATGNLSSRVTTLETDNSNIKTSLGDLTIGNDDNTSVSGRLYHLETAMGDYATTKEIDGVVVVTKSVAERVDDIEEVLGLNDGTGSTIGDVSTIIENERQARTEADAELATRLLSVEGKLGSSSESVDSRIMTSVQVETDARTNAVSSLSNTVTSNYNSLNSRVSTLESSVDGIPSSVDSKISTAVNTEKTAREAADTSHEEWLTQLENKVNSSSGALQTVTSIDQMTDTTARYILSTNNHWYYYDNNEWVDAGEFGGASIDSTLTQTGSAADAKATGDKIAELLTKLTTAESTIASIRSELTSLTNSQIDTLSSASTYSNYLSVIVDKSNKILAYFDKYGDLHVNGSIIAANL